MKKILLIIIVLLMTLIGCSQNKAQSNYVIYFQTNSDITLENLNLTPGEMIDLPIISREGYVFVGWYKNASLTNSMDIIIMPSHNIRLYAKWQKIEEVKNHFHFIIKENDLTKLVLELRINGVVELNGYQLKIEYDQKILEYKNHQNGLANMINADQTGIIELSYVNALVAINSHTLIATIEFNILDDLDIDIYLDVLEAIFVNQNSDIVFVDFTVSNFSIKK